MLEIACIVEPGIKYPANDDRVAVNKKLIAQGSFSETTDTSCLTVICDGVGGEAFGNEAAEIVTNIFSRLAGTNLTVDIINEYIVKVNEAVISAQKIDYKHSRMSTTVAGLYINKEDYISFNVGDTRIYRYRSYLSQISKDHSLREERINSGLPAIPGQENIITRYIGGMNAIPEIVNGTGRVLDKDVFVLCTDGVWGVLQDNDFEIVLSKKDKTERACQALIDLALQKKSKDNLSIIIVRKV